MGNLLNYREIHFLTHNKIDILNWKIGTHESLILYNAKIPLKILEKSNFVYTKDIPSVPNTT